jgi:hypothetical protein
MLCDCENRYHMDVLQGQPLDMTAGKDRKLKDVRLHTGEDGTCRQAGLDARFSRYLHGLLMLCS